MEILVPTLIAFTCALIIMSVGVLMKRKPIQGSCGGIANLMGGECEFCEKKSQCLEKKSEDHC